jgi:hypothetical protein
MLARSGIPNVTRRSMSAALASPNCAALSRRRRPASTEVPVGACGIGAFWLDCILYNSTSLTSGLLCWFAPFGFGAGRASSLMAWFHASIAASAPFNVFRHPGKLPCVCHAVLCCGLPCRVAALGASFPEALCARWAAGGTPRSPVRTVSGGAP